MSGSVIQNRFTDAVLRIVEPLIFGRRVLTLVVLALLTGWFVYLSSQTRVDAGWMKTVPLEHPYMKTFSEYYRDFGGANTVLVMLRSEDDDIYNERFLSTLQKVTDEVFFITGVDRARVMSMFTPNVRYVENVEGGLSGADVVPPDYTPTPEMFERIRSNVGKAQIIGRLVSEDQKSALVVAELLEIDPATGEKLDYPQVAAQLEQIRANHEANGLSVHIVGFAKVVGDMTDAATEVVGFFVLTLVLTTILLWVYCGSLKLALLPMLCSIVAVIWEFGLFRMAGFGLDPFAMLVPFLILAVSVSHGVQYVNAWADEVALHGKSNFDASLNTFRRLAIPGTVALITDTAGFLTILLIPIEVIREMSLNATFGMLAIIVTNKMLMPILLSYISLGDPEKFRAAQEKRDRLGEPLWRQLAKITRRGPAVTVIAVCLCLLAWAIWMHPKIMIGDAQVGVPELRPESRYNQDSQTIISNFAIGVDILKVIVQSQPDACIDYDVMSEVDRFSWHMENTTGVQSVMSLVTYAKLVYSGLNEGRLNAEILPRNSYALAQATSLVPTNTGLLNDDCDALALFIFTEDHKADTIQHIIGTIEQYIADNPSEKLEFKLASGNVGVMAASNAVVQEKEFSIVMWVYVVIVVFLWLSFRTLSGVLCVVLPLALVSELGYGVMVMLGIGMKVATLPIISLAVGIGVDYGIYIYSVLAEGLRRGLSLEEAYYETLRQTGKAVLFTGVALGLGVGTWAFSALQFQVDMGLLLLTLFTANMLGATLVLPALAHFLAGSERKRSVAEAST